MRLRLAVILCVVLLLYGCGKESNSLDKAMTLRSQMLSGDGCSFRTTVTADYGEKIYVFTMDCQTDCSGDLKFRVVEPATIAGITGEITGTGGTITFADKVLAFQTIADEQITPVSGPWLLVKTLRSGYLKGAAETENGFLITIDDSYQQDTLQLKIQTKDEKPVSGEIFWQGRRVLTLTVEKFTFL